MPGKFILPIFGLNFVLIFIFLIPCIATGASLASFLFRLEGVIPPGVSGDRLSLLSKFGIGVRNVLPSYRFGKMTHSSGLRDMRYMPGLYEGSLYLVILNLLSSSFG